MAAEQTTCRHLNEVIGADRRLSNITAWDIRRYQMKRLETVGAKTVNNELLVLTAVLKNARLWSPLRENYEALPVLKRGPGQALTPEQTAKLIETAKTNDHWFVALCATVLAYATGCRSGEIKKLQLGDLVLEGNRPFIRLRAENTKGRRSRDPALNDLGLWAVNHLVARARLIGRHRTAALPAAGRSVKAHQASRTHCTAGSDSIRPGIRHPGIRLGRALKKAAGLPGFRFHDLRHTHITHAIEEGVPIEVVMAQVGHVSPEMTRYYTHLGSNAKHDAVAAVQRRSSGVLGVLGPAPVASKRLFSLSAVRQPRTSILLAGSQSDVRGSPTALAVASNR